MPIAVAPVAEPPQLPPSFRPATASHRAVAPNYPLATAQILSAIASSLSPATARPTLCEAIASVRQRSRPQTFVDIRQHMLLPTLWSQLRPATSNFRPDAALSFAQLPRHCPKLTPSCRPATARLPPSCPQVPPSNRQLLPSYCPVTSTSYFHQSPHIPSICLSYRPDTAQLRRRSCPAAPGDRPVFAQRLPPSYRPAIAPVASSGARRIFEYQHMSRPERPPHTSKRARTLTVLWRPLARLLQPSYCPALTSYCPVIVR